MAIDAVQLERFIREGIPRQVVVVNAAKIVKMRRDPLLRDSILDADLVGPDGVPVVWASRLLGDPLPGRVNGTDLMYRLLEVADRKGYGMFFFGAREEVIRRVVEIVRCDYPGVRIAGWRNGYFSPEQERDIAQQIRRSHADILLLGFGTPAKEKWVRRYLQVMGVPVCHGVGGSFDVMAGVVPRAPVWMQQSGLEWLWRLLQEPGRMWRRYLVTNTMFVARLGAECVRRTLTGKAA